MLFKKANGKWRIWVNFTDLNKACPKDRFLLPQIDLLVDSTHGLELLTFMDAISGYNPIKIHKPNQDKTSLNTDRCL